MKKLLVGITIVGLAVLVFGSVGFAYAQGPNPPAPETPSGYGRGMMGQSGGMVRSFGGGLQAQAAGNADGEYGPVHELMVAALADALDLAPEVVESRIAAGETTWQIAAGEGLTADEVQVLLASIHDIVYSEAAAEGLVAPQQASGYQGQMRGNGIGAEGFGGGCPVQPAVTSG